MSNIDKREIHNQQLKAFITGFLGDPAHDNQSSRSLTAEVFRIALASLEAKPLGYIDAEYAELLKSGHIESCSVYAEQGEGCITVFSAPPAPVSVPDEYVAAVPTPTNLGYEAGWNACRAAMLQGAEPVTTDCKLPANVIDALEKALQAMSFMGDTLNALDAVCEEDVEYVTPAFEAVLEVLEGNSPVIPDSWVACSERNPEEAGRYWCYVEEQNDLGKSHYQWNCSWNEDRWWVECENGGRVTHWMPLPAAPQQEA